MIAKVVKDYPFQVVATTLRKAITATRNDWGAICYCDGKFYQAQEREGLEIFDRVGGGDSFASGLIYGFLSARSPQWNVECGAAHRCPGDDHAGRHQHGHPEGSHSSNGRQGRSYREIGAGREISVP